MADPRWTRGSGGSDASDRDEIHLSAPQGDSVSPDPALEPSSTRSATADALPSEAATPASPPAGDATAPDEPADEASSAPDTGSQPAEALASFDEFGLSAELRNAIRDLGWERPTPVQSETFEPVSQGRDVVVQSQTGTGKTGAFCLPWLAARFQAGPARQTGVQLIVLVPTRELAKQVCDQLIGLAKHTSVVPLPVYGGTAMQPQLQALRDGVHAVVGTPGRVLDHIRRRTLDLSRVRMVVLDEADEMLSMGFLEDIHAILDACPTERQTTLFSATVPPDVERIARRYMRNPVPVKLSGDQVAAAEIEHAYYTVSGTLRTRDLLDVVALEEPTTALVFCNTREETNVVANVLQREGYRAEALSSDLTQRARERVLGWMRSGRLRFLVATDVASRGIDISHISHVINYTFPENAESYIHRTGRTGRAGRPGRAISLIAPQDLGNFYYLKLQYPTIKFEERKLPPKEELEHQRMENKLDHVSKLFPELVSPEWTLLARNLMRDPRGEQVIAYLLSNGVSQAQAEAVRPEDEEAQMRADLEEDRQRDREPGEYRRGGRDRRDRHRPERGERRRDRGDRWGDREAGARTHGEARDHEVARETDIPGAAEPGVDTDALEPTAGAEPPGEHEDGLPAALAEGEAVGGEGRRRRRRRRGKRGRSESEATETMTETQPSAEVEAIAVTEAQEIAPPEAANATEAQGTGAAVEIGAQAGVDLDDASVIAPEVAVGIEPSGGVIEATDTGDVAEESRRKRRRRRRRRRGGRDREDEIRTEAAASSEDEGEEIEGDGPDREAAPHEASEGAEGAEGAEGGRRKRRRRRGGRRRRRGEGEDGAQPLREAPQEKRFAQDEIVIDIDEQELEFVRGEFGEIDELDDLTLKGRRRGVIESLQDEVELEDLSDSDRGTRAADEGDEGAREAGGDEDETEGEEVGAAEAESTEVAEVAPDEGAEEDKSEDEGERRRRKRRRRRKKKKEEAPPPELTAPPHKDFWEVWAAHYTYKDFEDIELPETEKVAEERVESPRSSGRISADTAGLSSVEEDDSQFMTVRLNCGRKHGKKAADIREILSTRLGLGGRSVRNLTVGDASTRFRISQSHESRLMERLHGFEMDGLELQVTIVETASAETETEAAAAEIDGETAAAPTDESNHGDVDAPSEMAAETSSAVAAEGQAEPPETPPPS